jgi:succinyl-CoA synthetase alpha subunit|nr:MAG TPA: hypothetical protein [Caudoviricetes sp.]
MNKEEMIKKHMDTLGITRDEAIQLIADDEEIDHMTRTSDIDGDLTDEQRKSAKKARQADRKPTVYKFDTSKRTRKENTGKRALIETIKEALENSGCTDLEVTNIEREIVFFADGTKYKIVLSAPRK